MGAHTVRICVLDPGGVDRWGHRNPERYPDDRRDLKGMRLKLMCRTGALPVMRRFGREQRPPWPLERRRCYACHTAVKTVSHFLGQCRAYAGHRCRLLNTVPRARRRRVYRKGARG